MILAAKKLIDPKKDLTDISVNPISKDGNFGVVYKGVYHKRKHGKDEEFDCAIKKLKSQPITPKEYEEIYREISAQNLLSHPALLPLYGFYIPFCQKGKCTIVTPFMENGSLHRLLQKEIKSQAPKGWNDTTRAINIFGIAAGMCYMHQQKMLHRDLKTDNILLDNDLYPQICDFGCTKVFEEGLEAIVTATILGTPVYMAPELLNGEDYNSKVDVFAYAMILYELIALYPAYEDPHNPRGFKFMQTISEGKRPKLDKRFSDFFKNLIEDCWAHKPGDRPPFVEIIKRILTAYKNEEIFIEGEIDRDVFNTYVQKAIKPLNLDEVPDIDF